MYSNSAVDRCLQMFLSQRKERESNPQGLSCKLGRLPTGSRRLSVCPSILCFSSSTRNRTWNFSLEARDDVCFTIEPCCLRQLIEPTERKARESNPHLYSRTALAVQPSKPYLATFQFVEWSHRDSNSGPRHAMAMSSRWTMTPSVIQRRGSFENRTRSSFLPRTRAPGTLTNQLPPVIAEGIEPSISCVSCRCLSRWTTRSC
jgi:hypothetical protein